MFNSFKFTMRVSAPLLAAPSRTAATSVAVLAFFRGLPLNPITFTAVLLFSHPDGCFQRSETHKTILAYDHENINGNSSPDILFNPKHVLDSDRGPNPARRETKIGRVRSGILLFNPKSKI
jgi:hypothetical protein